MICVSPDWLSYQLDDKSERFRRRRVVVKAWARVRRGMRLEVGGIEERLFAGVLRDEED
jgi:hypothetical protein